MEVLGRSGMLAGKVMAMPDQQREVDGPDQDAMKMFVGQVPRSMDEEELKEFFSEFGSVHQLNILRDKSTGVSRGCCFVTYYTRRDALEAQNRLHNIKVLPGRESCSLGWSARRCQKMTSARCLRSMVLWRSVLY